MKAYISEENQQFIADNQKVLTVSQISKETKLKYSLVISYMKRKNMETLFDRKRSKAKKKRTAKKDKNKFFRHDGNALF